MNWRSYAAGIFRSKLELCAKHTYAPTQGSILTKGFVDEFYNRLQMGIFYFYLFFSQQEMQPSRQMQHEQHKMSIKLCRNGTIMILQNEKKKM